MARSTSQKPWQAPDRSGEHANSSADEGAARAGLQAISLLAGPAGSLDGDVDVLTMGDRIESSTEALHGVRGGAGDLTGELPMVAPTSMTRWGGSTSEGRRERNNFLFSCDAS